MTYKTDCKHYTGYKPCHNQSRCARCRDYTPEGARILIVKLGAIGDVIRTTPLLTALKRKYPESHITWVTSEGALPVLEGIPLIDRLFTLDFKTYLRLSSEWFNLLLSLDKDVEAVAFADSMNSNIYQGFRLNNNGKIVVREYGKIDEVDKSQYALSLGLHDDLKFRKNQLSYQSIIFQQCGFEFADEECILLLTESEQNYGREFLRKYDVDRGNDKVIGLNTGCGRNWPRRRWGENNWIQLCRQLIEALPEARILLLGGIDEKNLNRRIQYGICHQAASVEDQTIKQFASIIACCDTVVTADTMAMHMATALKVPPVVLLGPTHTPEIYLYGRGVKVVSDFPCVPCFRQECDVLPGCVESIPVERVIEAIWEVI